MRVVADDQLGDRLGHELEAVGVARAGRRLPLPGGEARLERDLLALRGEEDARQPRAELTDEPRRDLRSERLRPHDLARREVEGDRTVRADRAPVQAELGAEEAHAPRPAGGDEDDADAGRAGAPERRAAALGQRAVGAQQRPVEVDGG